jgi:Beta-galactosidase, domain 2/Glycosyl hydrolases family 35
MVIAIPIIISITDLCHQNYDGTNWGNLGYHGGSTTYDYGAAITEGRLVWREKYGGMKLEVKFFKFSLAYLTAKSGNAVNDEYVTTFLVTVTPLFGNGTNTNFYVVKHTYITSSANATYMLNVSTSLVPVLKLDKPSLVIIPQSN